jgi:hypothetical protein
VRGRDPLEDTGKDGRKMLRLIFRKLDGEHGSGSE